MLASLIITTICLAFLFLWRKRIAHTGHPTPAPSPWRCVSIRPTRGRCCAACEAISERRFLPREAPRLPLEQCDARECTCVYRHHADRRSGPNRRGALNRPAVPTDRRLRRDRRVALTH